jgi:phosphoserine phosphatase RsbX
VILDVRHLSTPKAGETANGDAVVLRVRETTTLIAVIDALGHGPAAQATAQVAVDYLVAIDWIPSIKQLIDGLHRQLHGTRGAAVLVCTIDGSKLSGCSVGNVEMRSKLSRVAAIPTPGVLGMRLRNPRIFESSLLPGERLIVFSDGLSAKCSTSDVEGLAAADACRQLMRLHRRAHDDATVLVADVMASRSERPRPR